ncbi:MAG: glycosyltransferase, partial [Candidatus Zixiibacteriota bacterium]
VVCEDFPTLKNVPVEERPWSKETLATDLASSNIGLAPLPDNPFTRGTCSFKVLEYSAAGLPVVASPVGTNAEHVRDSVTGFLAKSGDEWIERITQLIESPQLRVDMGKQGREFAREFDASIIGERLTDVMRDCIGSK